MVPHKNNTRVPLCSTLNMFILSLAFSYFTKTLSGTSMKSAITQIERRFDLSSTLSGLIDASFEIGNLLFLPLVSHFGPKLHRPRLMGCGCFLMSFGSAVTGLPHFFMGQYKYDTIKLDSVNQTVNVVACQDLTMQNNYMDIPLEHSQGFEAGPGCLKEPGSSLWVYVLLGNALRGIGETPLMPLGISYIDDFAKAENSAIYIACLNAVALVGPIFGYVLGSLFAKLYVDLGFVNTETLTITPNDIRWVGAWWLGFFVSSALLLLSGIPFWFFPRSLVKQEAEHTDNQSSDRGNQEHTAHSSVLCLKWFNTAKGFLFSLKKLLGSPIYSLILFEQVLIFSSLIGFFTFMPKYMEQHFGLSSHRANFLIAMILLFLQFVNKCDNIRLAGLTVSYNSTPQISYDEQMLFSECNQNCSCSATKWDPVCYDGITYMSPCLAGCTSSTGHGKNTIFHNCSCVLYLSPQEGSTSVSLGQCPRAPECSRSFTSFMTVFGIATFTKSLGMTPMFMVMIRCVVPELKSLAIGIQTLAIRTLAGILSPVYFGAVIDSTCLKWSMRKCRSQGSCRMYDINMYRIVYLSLMTSLFGSSLFFGFAVVVLLRNQLRMEQTHQDEMELRGPNQHCNNGNQSESLLHTSAATSLSRNTIEI